MQKGVRVFTTASLGGLIAVLIGGFIGGDVQLWFWGTAILLDVLAAGIGGQVAGWRLHTEHFVERHGLFTIIALGETLIVAAGGATGAAWNSSLMAVVVLSVALTCGLWWSYFTRAQPALAQAMEESRGSTQTQIARDAFSLLHFLMMSGVIAYAVAIEEMIIHPTDPLPFLGRVSFSVGLILFVGGTAIAIWRSTGRIPWTRVLLTILTASVILIFGDAQPWITLALGFLGLLILLLFEHRRGVF